MKRTMLIVPLLLLSSLVTADELPKGELVAKASDAKVSAPKDDAAKDHAAKTTAGPKVISGMSILGNQEAPKALVIVPWKSSEIGDSLGIATLLDDSRRPVDRDVFMRELSYYEVRSGSK
jgi:hypothetical protein